MGINNISINICASKAKGLMRIDKMLDGIINPHCPLIDQVLKILIFDAPQVD